jgi:site-specific DNA recombinase
MKENSVRTSSALGNGNQKRIGIWIRVSTEDQAQGESPAHHEHRARAYAESKGWTVCEVYDLAGVSGKSVMEQPEAKRMLADVKRGHISGLIFSKLARLARNTRELLDFSDIFRANNADLISLQESIDTSTPAGRLFYTMIAAMAQWEREEIADRVKASVTVRAMLGKPLNGTTPYGYRWMNKQLVPHPEQAPIRKLAYELFLEHRRKVTVAKILNERGYRTSTNSLWRDISVGRILVDPTAKGLRVYGSSRKVGCWKAESRPESDWITVPVEPIVSETLWNDVNQILEEQTKAAKRPGRKSAHLFAGLIHCYTIHVAPVATSRTSCRLFWFRTDFAGMAARFTLRPIQDFARSIHWPHRERPCMAGVVSLPHTAVAISFKRAGRSVNRAPRDHFQPLLLTMFYLSCMIDR